MQRSFQLTLATVLATVLLTPGVAVGKTIIISGTQGGTFGDVPDIGDGISDGSGMDGIIVTLSNGVQFLFDSGTSSPIFDFSLIGGGSFSTTNGSHLAVYDNAEDFGPGSYVASTDSRDFAYTVIFGAVGPWVDSFNDKFIGYMTGDGVYGTIGVDWSYDSGTSLGTMSLFEVESAESSVPAPAAALLVMQAIALLGLAAHRRRIRGRRAL